MSIVKPHTPHTSPALLLQNSNILSDDLIINYKLSLNNKLQIRRMIEVVKSTLFDLEYDRVRRSIAFSWSHIFLSLGRKCINLKADCVL